MSASKSFPLSANNLLGGVQKTPPGNCSPFVFMPANPTETGTCNATRPLQGAGSSQHQASAPVQARRVLAESELLLARPALPPLRGRPGIPGQSWTNLADVRIWPMSQVGRILANRGRLRPQIGRNRPKFGRIRANVRVWARIGRSRPGFGRVGRCWSKLPQIWTHVAGGRSHSTGFCPMSAKFGLDSAKCVCVWTGCGPGWAKLAECAQLRPKAPMAEVGKMPPKFDRGGPFPFGRDRPTLVESMPIWAEIGRICVQMASMWPKPANTWPKSGAKFNRTRTHVVEFGPIWAQPGPRSVEST